LQPSAGADFDFSGEIARTAIAASPGDAGLHHALGLVLTRLKRTDEAMAELRRAAELEPDRARYAYVHAVALHSAGRSEQAIAVLKENLARHPEDRDTLLALVTFSRDAGDLVAALEYAERLARLVPGDRDVANLVRSLQSQLQKPDGK
jgi:Flp pilus assembly protein TadD